MTKKSPRSNSYSVWRWKEEGIRTWPLINSKSASDLDPENESLKEKKESVIASLSSGSRYDYLLNMKLVTSEQLQKALALSKKARKSVEFVLIDQFKVKKEDVGKSLSLFYDCPFVSFDPKKDAPVELIANLKKAFLLA